MDRRWHIQTYKGKHLDSFCITPTMKNNNSKIMFTGLPSGLWKQDIAYS